MKNMNSKPIIGITPDLAQNCEKYSYAAFPWYALRKNYAYLCYCHIKVKQ